MLVALIQKEFYQIIRDISSVLIAFVLPVMILFLYRFAVNLDTVKVSIGIKNDDINPKISTLISSFDKSKYIKTEFVLNEDEMFNKIRNSKLRGAVIIPNDFVNKLEKNNNAEMFAIADGSETNLANFVSGYVNQIANEWLKNSSYGLKVKPKLIQSVSRVWYNQDLNSHYFILPGSLAITMNMIGILLTALVISREWERGTIEGLFCTNITKMDFILSKYISYFILGVSSFIFNVLICIFIFDIPFCGNFLILILIGSLYLFSCLGVGLLISSSYKDQFSSSQMALSFGLLPALMLSGLIYPISSMPVFFQYLTAILPPRYFITFIQSEFMAGSIFEIILINSLFLLVLGLLLFILVYFNFDLRLEKCNKKE